MKHTIKIFAICFAMLALATQAEDKPSQAENNSMGPARRKLNERLYEANLEAGIKQYQRIREEIQELQYQFELTAPHSAEEKEALNGRVMKYVGESKRLLISLIVKADNYDSGNYGSGGNY